MERLFSVFTGKKKEQENNNMGEYSKRKPMEVYKSKFCFLLIGMGMSMCWYSISAAIPYWNEEYGKNMYRYLLIAYNGAALVIVVAQMWDDKYNDQYGTALTYAFRVLLAACILLACEIILPVVPHSTAVVLVIVAIAGTFDSVGFGAVTQLASLYPAGTSGYVFVGQSLCSIFLLILTFAVKFTADATQTQLNEWFFSSSAMILLCAIGGFIYLSTLGLYHHVCDFKEQFDGYSRLVEENGLSPSQSGEKGTGIKKSLSINASMPQPIAVAQSFHLGGETSFPVDPKWVPPPNVEQENTSLVTDVKLVLNKTAGLQWDIVLCWFSTLLVQSMFTHVPSTGDPNTLSQVLVYVNLFATFFGQQLNLLFSKPFHTFRNISIALWIRAFSMVFFFLYLAQDLGFTNDWVIILYNIIFFVSGGFFTSQLYGMVAEAVPVSSRTMAISVTNVSLLLGIVVGILATLGVSAGLDD